MKVFVLADDQTFAQFLGRVLSEEGLSVDLCARDVDALAIAGLGLYDLFVLDWISEAHGLVMCRGIRRVCGPVCILALMAPSETPGLARALEAGADDCLFKPFEVAEFVARVWALLRRAVGLRALSVAPYRCGELEIDHVLRQARLAGVALTLTQGEYGLLLHLVDRAGKVVTRSELLAHVWGLHQEPNPNFVAFHIHRLREKFRDRAWMLETVGDVGLRLRRDNRA